MKPTIKISFQKLEVLHNLAVKDLITVENLGYYGFNDTIIKKMIEFDIFPQTLLIEGAVYVIRADIFGAVEKILQNTMLIYEDVEKSEKEADEFKKLLEDSAVKFTPEDLARVKRLEISLPDLIEELKTKHEGETIVQD